MSELTVGVDSSETLWTVDAVPDPEFGFYTVGSEIVQVIAGFPGGDPGYAVGQTFPAKIRVIRGTNGTSAASHLSSAALTAANAFAGGGGGGVTVEVPPDAPVAVTNIIAPGAVIVGDEADLSGVLQFRLLGPFHIAFGDAGLVDPNNNGLLALTVPAGSLYRAIVLSDVEWDPDCQMTVAIGTNGPVVAGYRTAGRTTAGLEYVVDPGVVANAENVVNNLPSWALAATDTDLYVAIFTLTEAPTAGSGDVYALIATLAA